MPSTHPELPLFSGRLEASMDGSRSCRLNAFPQLPLTAMCPLLPRRLPRSLDGPRGIILTEYCDGRDLHKALQLRSATRGDRAFGWYGRGRRVALDVAKALNYLHSEVRPAAGMHVQAGGCLA